MTTRNRALGALAGVFAFIALSSAAFAADRPYTDGPVSVVTGIRTEPGMWDDYMAWLAGPWKQAMEAQKAAGLIVAYRVYSRSVVGANEPDLYLVTTYRNYAALDGLRDKLEPIYERLQGSLAAQNKAYAERGKLRTVMGDDMIQELMLK